MANCIQKPYFALILNIILISTAIAAPEIMSAPEAQAAVKAGRMILLDVRSTEEWREDGLAEGALPVSMHEFSFGTNLNKILGQRGDKKLGLICATGGRTKYLAFVLDKSGVNNVVDVSEGMHGNHRGSGWIKRKMPINHIDQALKHYKKTIK